jgi:very-short-patch-repair endonuclease
MIFRYPHILSPIDVVSSLGPLIVILLLIAIAFVVFRWLLTQLGSSSSNVTFHRRPLMTQGELAFFTALQPAAGLLNSHVFVQVSLAALIDVRSSDKSARTAANNRIDRKIVDFVLVDKKTMGVQAVVELDDRSHLLEDRRTRDEVVNEAVAKAGIKIIRFPAQASYNSDQIFERITKALAIS